MEFLRFLVVSVTGVLVDIGIGWLLASALGAPLWLAAATGFAVAAGLNYLLHRSWTFQQTSAMAEQARVLRYLASLGLTFMARMATVVGLGALLGPKVPALMVLVPSVGVSFVVSFLAAKFLVFHSGKKGTAG